LPLLFMGEEYAETSPFQYFVSHQNPNLINAVRQGRRNEFKAFDWNAEPPDPQNPATFLRSQLDWNLQERSPHKELRDLYAELLRMRKQYAALRNCDFSSIEATAFEDKKSLLLRRWQDDDEVFALFNFGRISAELSFSLPERSWSKVLASRDRRWAGQGSSLPDCLPAERNYSLTIEPFSVVLYYSGTGGKG